MRLPLFLGRGSIPPPSVTPYARRKTPAWISAARPLLRARPSPAGPSGLRRLTFALIAIAAVALLVRWWGAQYGLPFIYSTDEGFEVKRALQLGAGHFDAGRAFKGGLFYLLFVEYGIYYAILTALGQVHSAGDFLQRYFEDPTPLWLMGRLTVGLMGALTVLLVYRLGSKLYGTAAGILAALFLTFSLDHVRSSHWIGVDIPMTALLVAALLTLIEMERTGSIRSYLLTALFAALSTLTKLPAVLLLVPITLVHLRRARLEGKGVLGAWGDRRFLYGVLLFLAVTLVGNPGFFAAFGELIAERAGLRTAPAGVPEETYSVRAGNIWLFYVRSLVQSLGLPVLLSALALVVVRFRRATLSEAAIGLFVLLFYVSLCLPHLESRVYARYTLPMQAVLVVAAGGTLSELARRAGARRWLPLAAALCLIFMVPPVLSYDRAMTRTDSRTSAKNWIEATIPAGASIVIEGSGYTPSHTTVPLYNSRQNVERILRRFRERDAAWQGRSVYADRKDRFHGAYLAMLEHRKTFDLILCGTETFPYRSLDEYIEMGAEYLVVQRETAERFLREENAARYPQVAGFYRQVGTDPRLDRIRVFPPDGSLGPTVEIHRVIADRKTAAVGQTTPAAGSDRALNEAADQAQQAPEAVPEDGAAESRQ